MTEAASIAERIDTQNWHDIEDHLGQHGWAVLSSVLDAEQCRDLAAVYDEEGPFRSHIIMARHGFGQGEYRYFGYPLPQLIQELREQLYSRLVGVANAWSAAMRRSGVAFPATHAAFIERCHADGQTRPTPLLLRYGAGDYNCLHQDVYGDHLFPLQVTVLLSEPQTDFSGGEFVLVEQRPRMQSRVMVVPLGLGDAVVFAVNQRPVEGTRGSYRVTMRHGVSEIREGQRHTLGVIFHDAK
jgi:uncharacterized protein